MTLVSRIALASALTIGLNAAALVAPAFAKKDAPAETMLAPTPAVRAAVASAQASLAARDTAGAEANVAAAEAAAASDYDRYLAQGLRLTLENAKAQGLSEQQRAQRLIPLETALIANPATPKAEVAQRYNERGNLMLANRKSADALQSFQSARDGGYTDADLLANIARARVAAGDVVGGIGDLDAAVAADKAAGRAVPEDVYRFAIAKLYSVGASAQVEDWMRRWLADYGTAENWRTAVYTLGLTGPDAPKYAKSKIDLYRLLAATKSLAGQKEYTDYADVALNGAGVPEEAKAVLRRGIDSGAIPAGNAAAAALQRTADAKLKGSTPALKEKRAMAGSSGDLAAQAGDAYLGTRDFAKAATLYRLAEQRRYSDSDRLNLHLGIALAQSGDRDGARVALDKVTSEPQRAIARLWMTYVLVAPAT